MVATRLKKKKEKEKAAEAMLDPSGSTKNLDQKGVSGTAYSSKD